MGVTFELYVKQKGRWNFEAKFDSHLRDAAIAEAKQLEPQVQATKVICERTDAEGNIRESTIYSSESSKTGRLTAEQRQAASNQTPSAASRGYANLDTEGDDESGKPASTPGGASSPSMSPEAMVLTKVTLIIACSFALAAFVTWFFFLGGSLVGA